MPAIKVGDSMPFRPANASDPKREILGVVTAVNNDGTVNVTAADGTPYVNVAVTAPPTGTGATPQGTGPASNATIAAAQAAAQAPQKAADAPKEKP